MLKPGVSTEDKHLLILKAVYNHWTGLVDWHPKSFLRFLMILIHQWSYIAAFSGYHVHGPGATHYRPTVLVKIFVPGVSSHML